MATPDALSQKQAARGKLQPTVKSHLAYTLLSGLAIMLMLSGLRLALLMYNREMIGDTPTSTFVEAFVNGLRFDLRLVVYLLIPLLLAALLTLLPLALYHLMFPRGQFQQRLTGVDVDAPFPDQRVTPRHPARHGQRLLVVGDRFGVHDSPRPSRRVNVSR